jgi:mannose-6-phosphate isomerase-like protein (cupin superfamily)
VSDATFQTARIVLGGDRGIIDLTATLGAYQVVAMMMVVDRFPLPGGAAPELKPLAAVSTAAPARAQQPAMTRVTRLYTGADGQSHAEDIDVAWRTAKLRAELSESESAKVTGAQFLRWPRGFVWEGHPASKRQYVVIVSGRGQVDVAGGKPVELAPGRVLLAEDTTGKGHITRVGNDEDLVMLLVPLAPER